MQFPVIDIFAGPGGLGEGFAAFRSEYSGTGPFRIALSIDKDEHAHRTLQLRSFFRQFGRKRVPAEYYQYVQGKITRQALFEYHSDQAGVAGQEAWRAELGKEDPREVSRRIDAALGGREDWVLIGSPPCQAYSTIGRSRMRGMRTRAPSDFEEDNRHFLYKEYLRILRAHKPPVFVMENVKGLLSSRLNGSSIFLKMKEDFQRKVGRTPGYNIYSFVMHAEETSAKPLDYVIRTEHYGIPQARHRVVLLGIRRDLQQQHSRLQRSYPTPTTKDAINDLPRIRSILSKERDCFESWITVLEEIFHDNLLEGYPAKDVVMRGAKEAIKKAKKGKWKDTGSDVFTASKNYPRCSWWIRDNADWFLDDMLSGGACNHAARAHRRDDLRRYLFASSYAAERGVSPCLRDFPVQLLPAHRNVPRALGHDNFTDRFRVQMASKPATTVVSHIAKDGHYYIHYDPAQCRSLTVREAARLQTFPDNYFFEGPRTQQYYQVGNAVPPLLARQLAAVVNEIMATNFAR